MAGRHAYVDESCPGDYLVMCSLVASSDATAVRQAMRGLLLPRQRSIHMKDERKGARQDRIIRTVCALDLGVTIYSARPADHRGQSGARDACLQRLAADSVRNEVDRMILDRSDATKKRDAQSIRTGATSAGARGVPFSYDHLSRHDEPLLWVPDVVGWCYARGGRLRRQVMPIVKVIEL